MAEPEVTMTNLLLAVECWVFVALLHRRHGSSEVVTWFRRLFAVLGAAAALGAIVHGFIADDGSALSRAVWTTNLLMLGAAGVAVAMIAASILVAAGPRRYVHGLLAAAFAFFAVVVLFLTQDYAVALVATLPAIIFLLVALVVLYRRTAIAGLLFGIAGLVATLLAGMQQQLQLGFGPMLDHNAVYHLIQIVAFWLLFRAVAPTDIAVRQWQAIKDGRQGRIASID